jgi:molybdate transport system ATP-binding protein
MVSAQIKKSLYNFTLDVSFEAGNDILALLGASGCGKSMTLKCIAGVVKPDSGRIVLNGRVLYDSRKGINLSPQNRKTGLLFQNYALFPNMTVEENILSALRRSSVSDKKERLDGLLEMFYLSGRRFHYPAQLSGGQQQRTALARILASEPEIIMLDEPLSALDSFLRWHLEQELIGVMEKFSGTVLYVSHNRDEVYRVSRKVCVINNGISETVMNTRDFFEAPPTRSAALLSGCKNFSRAKKIGENRIYALDWGCELESGPASDDTRHIGVRAHAISLVTDRVRGEAVMGNTITCEIGKIIQDIFSVIMIVIPPEQGREGRREIRLELPKSEAEGLCTGDMVEIGIAPKDILLLRQGPETSLEKDP